MVVRSRTPGYDGEPASKGLADFKQLSLLGEGSYSAVYKVLRLADGEHYALKKVKLPSLSEKEQQNALNEVRLLASVRHESVISYKEAFLDDKTRCLCIVMEYADAGDLFHEIVKCQKERTHVREADAWRYLFGMCHGLKALHDMRILHRDLKCANVFLHNQEGVGVVAKLGDFNVSKVAKRGLCMTQTGTPYYASPEVWRDMPYDAKSDMWSLGCVLYELAALRPPFRAEDMEGLYRKVLRGQYPRIPPHYGHDLSEVIALLLQVNPRHRPSIDQLLQMPVMHRHEEHVPVGDGMCDLLQTIKMPKNHLDISVLMPLPQYQHPWLEERASQVGSHVGVSRGGTPPHGVSRSAISSADLRSSPQAPASANESEAAGPGDIRRWESDPSSSRQADAREAEVVPSDSLDAYLQQQAPPRQQPRQARGHESAPHPHPGMPPSSQEDLDVSDNASALGGGRSRHAKPDPPPEYGNYGRQAQSNLAQSIGRQAPGNLAPPQYDLNRDPLAPPTPGGRVQPPSSYGNAQPPSSYGNSQPHQAQRQAQPREGRRGSAMAQYARPQYALGGGTGGRQQPPGQQQKQSGGVGLRLPRLFSRAS